MSFLSACILGSGKEAEKKALLYRVKLGCRQSCKHFEQAYRNLSWKSKQTATDFEANTNVAMQSPGNNSVVVCRAGGLTGF